MKAQPRTTRGIPSEKPAPVNVSEPANAPRLSVSLRDDGSINVESLRAETRRKLESALPRLNADLRGPESSSAPAFPREVGAAVVGVLQQVEFLIVQRITKAPGSILVETVSFTAQERDALEPLTAQVLSKYLGGRISKYAEEFALGLLLISITQAKINATTLAMKARPAPVEVFRQTIPPTTEPAPAEKPEGDE